MPTVRDLYLTVAADTPIELQEARHVCRVMQESREHLPVGTVGGSRSAPEITIGHCIQFLFVVVGTRTGFPRTISGVRRSVQMFEKLTGPRPRGDEGLTFLAAQLEKEVKILAGPQRVWRPAHLLFRNHELRPYAEIQYIGRADEVFTTGFSAYGVTEEEAEISSTDIIANCLYMDAKILHVFAKMFPELQPPDEGRGGPPA